MFVISVLWNTNVREGGVLRSHFNYFLQLLLYFFFTDSFHFSEWLTLPPFMFKSYIQKSYKSCVQRTNFHETLLKLQRRYRVLSSVHKRCTVKKARGCRWLLSQYCTSAHFTWKIVGAYLKIVIHMDASTPFIEKMCQFGVFPCWRK